MTIETIRIVVCSVLLLSALIVSALVAFGAGLKADQQEQTP